MFTLQLLLPSISAHRTARAGKWSAEQKCYLPTCSAQLLNYSLNRHTEYDIYMKNTSFNSLMWGLLRLAHLQTTKSTVCVNYDYATIHNTAVVQFCSNKSAKFPGKSWHITEQWKWNFFVLAQVFYTDCIVLMMRRLSCSSTLPTNQRLLIFEPESCEQVLPLLPHEAASRNSPEHY